MKAKHLALIVCALLVFGACSSGTDSGDSGSTGTQTIKIATASPLSGSNSAIGKSIANGAELALLEHVEEFAALGFTLEIYQTDDQATATVGVANAERLVDDQAVLAVVGHYNSGVAIPSSEVYNAASLAMVSPGNTAVEVTERGYPTVSRICGRDDCQGPAGADFIFNDLGLKTVYIIHDNTTYGIGIAQEFQARFEALGGEVKGFESITPGEADFSAVEELVRASGAESVYFGGIYPEGSLLIKQFSEKGINVKFVGPDGMDSADLVNIAGETVIGTYYTSVAAGAAEEFNTKYEAKYSVKPESWSGYGYDAMTITINAIKAVIEANGGAMPTREEVAAKIRETSGYKGVATNVTLNSIGDNTEANIFIFGFNKAEYPPEVVTSIPVTEYLK